MLALLCVSDVPAFLKDEHASYLVLGLNDK